MRPPEERVVLVEKLLAGRAKVEAMGSVRRGPQDVVRRLQIAGRS